MAGALKCGVCCGVEADSEALLVELKRVAQRLAKSGMHDLLAAVMSWWIESLPAHPAAVLRLHQESVII